MTRREFALSLAARAAAWPLRAYAQQQSAAPSNPVRQAWLDRRKEPILETGVAHRRPATTHFVAAPRWRYLLDDLLLDTNSGHNIVATVFVAGEFDVSRQRPSGNAPRRGDRVREWHRGNERQRHLWQDQGGCRHCRARGPNFRQSC